jgi:integrase
LQRDFRKNPIPHLRLLVIVALGLGLRKSEQLTLRRGQVDFSCNIVIATRTKGRKNREISLDVLNPEVREILKKACHGNDAEDYVFTNPDTDKPFYDIKRSSHSLPHCWD